MLFTGPGSLHQFILTIGDQLTLFADDELKKIENIFSVQFAGIRWHGCGEIAIANNGNTFVLDRFPVLCHWCVTAC